MKGWRMSKVVESERRGRKVFTGSEGRGRTLSPAFMVPRCSCMSGVYTRHIELDVLDSRPKRVKNISR